uniref:Uncharacterized protein n=1 Tax=Rhizophora mucronata TaxID=61149 RepID=A0A2P2QXS7_RHIMU
MIPAGPPLKPYTTLPSARSRK